MKILVFVGALVLSAVVGLTMQTCAGPNPPREFKELPQRPPGKVYTHTELGMDINDFTNLCDEDIMLTTSQDRDRTTQADTGTYIHIKRGRLPERSANKCHGDFTFFQDRLIRIYQ